ncbi:MAG: heavy metal translocating P-type ATPase, partial [Anaerolineales bacterium]|nr:heavy metal translocating P-type ATPase [Anaerolineales bacterium]
MNEKTVQLDIPLLLPDIQDTRDNCVAMLERMLEHQRGIQRVHVKHEATPAQLCLHYDPNLTSLATVQRIAQDVGGRLTNRYRHEALAITGMNTADAATTLSEILSDLPGMLHVSVNYAAGTAFVAYDTTILQQARIRQAIGRMGYQAAAPTRDQDQTAAADTHEEEAHEEHDHGSAPSFLPHWLQERWELLLVALAGIFFLVGWLGETFFNLPQTAALILFVLAYVAGGYDIATHAIPGLLKGKFDTDVLMLAAAVGAAVLGEWAEGAFLLFLFSLGHAGEHYALDRARNAIDALGELMPQTARVKQNGDIVERPVDAVKVDDVVVVRPRDRIPVDGEIIRGRSAIDQSAITGESVPVNKEEGDEVFAGTINQENALDIRVTKLAKDNTLNRVMQMV